MLNGSHPKIVWLVNTFAVVSEQKQLESAGLGHISHSQGIQKAREINKLQKMIFFIVDNTKCTILCIM